MKTATKILLTALCLFIATSTFAQSQKQHVIQSGETIYAIARKYGISPNDIIQANPSVGTGDKIRPGQTLVIPGNKAASTTTTAQPTATAAPKPAAKPAETQPAKTSTTTSPAQTHAAQATTTTTPTTTKPTTPATTVTAAPSAQTEQQSSLKTWYKELYRIQKKDNLYRIALLYNLTIEELVEANPGLTVESKLKKGEFLYIPYSRAEKQAEAERIAAEKAAAEAAAKAAADAAKRKTLNNLKVAVILPMKEGGDRGNKMIEFYRGILMAADSLKHQGTTINMYAYHSGSTQADMQYLTSKSELKSMDIIFGPLTATQAGILSDFCKENKIRLVMPFATTNTVGTNNPYVYQASINSEAARKNGSDIVASRFSKDNCIILQTGTPDERGKQFIGNMKNQFAGRGATSKSLAMEADDATWLATLSRTKTNVIIPDASSLSATSTLVKKLRNFQKNHPEYKITMVGYPEWPTYVSTLQADYHALDTYAYCPFYRNPSDARVAHFEANYKRNFKTEISRTYPRYGIFGFDLGFYFMNGLARLGDFFDEKMTTLNYTPLQNGFYFDQKNENSAHTNQLINLVHYTVSQRIEIIK